MTKQQPKAMDPNARLSFLERFSYGIGDFGANLIYSTISSFLLVYYVSVVGVDPAIAGSMLAISKIFDGVSDLIMGRIVDNTHTKWGKARPWLLKMSIPMGICAVLMFTVPASWGNSAQIAYMFLSYNLVSTVFYTGFNVPYATLQGLMTQNQYERGLLGNFRMLLATVGTMTVNTVVEPLCRFFNGGEVYEQYGWTISLIILAAGFIVVSVITTFFCKERVADDPQESADAVKAQNGPTITECLKSLVVNKYWLLEVGFLFVVFFMMSTFYGSSYYFAQFVLGDSSTFALISNTLTIAQIITMFLTPFFMKKLSKRWVAVIGMGLACVAFLLTALAGSNLMLVVFSNVLKGASFGCAAATMFGLLQDTITYGQWLTNVPAMGMGNAASSFCMKVGSGIGTAALGWILDAGGFDGQAATQTASGITALNIACIWVPIITCAIGGVCLLLFDLDKHYGKAVADLNEGKWKGSK